MKKNMALFSFLLFPGIANALPACGDAALEEALRERIARYQAEVPPDNIVGKRNQALALKDLRGFSEVSADGFTSKEDYPTANRLIELKINRHLSSDEVRVCKNGGSGRSERVYLIVYPDGEGHKLSIMNIARDRPELETEL